MPCCSPEQAEKYAAQMIGRKLITKQTGAAGRECNAVSSTCRGLDFEGGS